MFYRNLLLVILLSLSFYGCSTVNFSANYYSPPENYRVEVAENWKSVVAQLPLKNKYKISFVDGKESHRLKGIPAISNQVIYLPTDFIKYIYQNYYTDRFKILTRLYLLSTHPLSAVTFSCPY